jgi:hypothetical protein
VNGGGTVTSPDSGGADSGAEAGSVNGGGAEAGSVNGGAGEAVAATGGAGEAGGGLHAVGRRVADALGLEVGLIGSHGAILAPRTRPTWTSVLPVAELAVDSVALASHAIDLARSARSGARTAPVQVDGARVAASFGSERLLRIDGARPEVWGPLSGFWRASDGWVRTHGNYPHHDAALRGLLGVPADADRVQIERAIGRWSSTELEDAAHAVGAIVGAVRRRHEWMLHPHARVVAEAPTVTVTRRGDAAPRAWAPGGGRATLPLAGIRVIDMTRVLAGPVAARDLALAGAQVLRVDSPRLAETDWIHLDTGQGKRSTLLDLDDLGDRRAFDELLETADVVLTGYRPGALDRYGLDSETLTQRHPGVVTAAVSAWGESGPWAHRRGFDSIVQAVTGIAMIESRDGITPGALPVQALDHSTGHFLAAAIATALIEQRTHGGSIDVRMSLARVAHELLTDPYDPSPSRAEHEPPADARDPSHTRATHEPPDLRHLRPTAPAPDAEQPLPTRTRDGLTYAAPVLAFTGAPDDYATVGGRWGADPPIWAERH